jgi:hypothetical protein
MEAQEEETQEGAPRHHSGSNGSVRRQLSLHRIKGYDGPTGWGTPNGVKAF